MKHLLAILFFICGALLPISFAQETSLPPQEEARAQALMRELRCVACENEPISQSAAPIAEDMRTRVREMVADGASDEQVRDWFEDRYGEFVLFRPKAKGLSGMLLWALPFLLLLIGGAIAWTVGRRTKSDGVEIKAEDV